MVKHIVFWKLKEHAHGNSKQVNKVLIKEKLEALNGKIGGLLSLEVGLDFSASETSADVALYSVFGSRDDLAAYQAHPLHLAAASFVREAISERRVADYEI